jgi:capsule synthesis protein PGA_cap
MTAQTASTLTLLAGGDVGPTYEPAEQFADLIKPVLRQADVRFAQCERTYSSRGVRPQFVYGPSGAHSRLHPRQAAIFDAAHIDVVSVASNHAMDWGPDALLDTVELFRKKGIQPIGAGRDRREATAPAIVSVNGVTIAIMAYCSVIRDGQAARDGEAGIAPMRADTFSAHEDFQPGTPPVMNTQARRADIEAMMADIAAVKDRVDAVVISMHWGLRLVPKTICDYQVEMAHAAIDAGADLIIGHHPHAIKAVETYRDRVCFYSIGNFLTNGTARPGTSYSQWGGLFWFDVDEECAPPQGMYYLPRHCRMSMLAKAEFQPGGVKRVSFVPVYITGDARPYAVTRNDPMFQTILDYTENVSSEFPHSLRADGDEIEVFRDDS